MTFQGCTVNSHRAGTNFPNAQFNHLSKTQQYEQTCCNKYIRHTLELTKGDKKEQVEERGEGRRWQHSKDDIMHPPTRTNGHGHLEGGEQKWGHLVPSVAFEPMCYALGFQLKVEGGIKSPRLAPQSHGKK